MDTRLDSSTKADGKQYTEVKEFAGFLAPEYDLAGVPVFGAIIEELADKIGGLIDKAENAGQVLLSSAGAQVAAAIQYAKTAYIDSLDTTIDQITAAQKKFIDDISSEIGFIEHHILDQARQIVERGSMTINSLPLSNHFPQVGWYSPSYVAPGAKTFQIAFHGNFFDVPRAGYDPTLAVNGHTFTATVKTTFLLSFDVPARSLGAVAADIARVRLDLTVPYRKSILIGLLHERANATFSAVVSTLPARAGTIEFDTDHLEAQRFTETRVSGTFRQHSDDDDIPDPIGSGQVSSAPATPGWFINPADVHLAIQHQEGDWTDFGNRSNATTAAWSIGSRHHGFGDSGKVDFFLTWTEYQDRQVHVAGQQQQDLLWASSRMFRVPPGGTWSARYTDFRGKSFDIGSADFDNPFLKVMTSGDSVIVVTVP